MHFRKMQASVEMGMGQMGLYCRLTNTFNVSYFFGGRFERITFASKADGINNINFALCFIFEMV
jgi:hypothetical protein